MRAGSALHARLLFPYSTLPTTTPFCIPWQWWFCVKTNNLEPQLTVLETQSLQICEQQATYVPWPSPSLLLPSSLVSHPPPVSSLLSAPTHPLFLINLCLFLSQLFIHFPCLLQLLPHTFLFLSSLDRLQFLLQLQQLLKVSAEWNWTLHLNESECLRGKCVRVTVRVRCEVWGVRLVWG